MLQLISFWKDQQPCPAPPHPVNDKKRVWYRKDLALEVGLAEIKKGPTICILETKKTKIRTTIYLKKKFKCFLKYKSSLIGCMLLLWHHNECWNGNAFRNICSMVKIWNWHHGKNNSNISQNLINLWPSQATPNITFSKIGLVVVLFVCTTHFFPPFQLECLYLTV